MTININVKKLNLHVLPSMLMPHIHVGSGIASSTGKNVAIPGYGERWEEQGGILLATMPSVSGAPAYHIIFPTEDEAAAELTWGGSGETVEGISDIDGLANTRLLIGRNTNHPAAKFCADLRLHGHDDWYLLANREASLARAVNPGLFGPGYHWTSTQSSASGAFVQAFSDGNQYLGSKGSQFKVRAVRSIIPPTSQQSDARHSRTSLL